MSGNLAETSFIDLIQFYSISRQTAAVTIVSPAGPEHNGVLYIEGGDVVDAHFGELTGVEAVRRALRLKEGEFHVELNQRCAERTIFEPWGKLVLEEMVGEDEALNVEAAGGPSLEFSAMPQEPIAMMASETKQGPRYCPVCNRRYLSGTVCEDDGTQLLSGVPPKSQPSLPKTQPPMARMPPPPPPRSRKGLFIGLGAAAVAIAAAAGFVLWQRAEAEKQARVAAQQAAASVAEEAKAKETPR